MQTKQNQYQVAAPNQNECPYEWLREKCILAPLLQAEFALHTRVRHFVCVWVVKFPAGHEKIKRNYSKK